MPRLSSLVALSMFLLLAGCQGASQIDEGASSEGWTDLFDGQTLRGWEQMNGTATYRVEDGAILGRTAEGSPNSFLCTADTYDDFELAFEVDVDPELNSGVQIRSRPREAAVGTGQDQQAGRIYGPQVEIEAGGAEGAESGYIYGEATGMGWLTPEERLRPHTAFRHGAWNEFRVVAEGARIRTSINGQPIEDLTHEEIYRTHPEGHICLQVHGIPAGAGPYEVRWRNLRLREL